MKNRTICLLKDNLIQNKNKFWSLQTSTPLINRNQPNLTFYVFNIIKNLKLHQVAKFQEIKLYSLDLNFILYVAEDGGYLKWNHSISKSIKCPGRRRQSQGIVFYLLQRSGRGSKVIRSVGEGTIFSQQGTALRVVLIKPARSGFQGARGNRPPLGVRPGGLPVSPVSYVYSPSFHWTNKKDRKMQDRFRIKGLFLKLQEVNSWTFTHLF